MSDRESDSAQNRRSMFRFGFRKLMEPVADYIEGRLEVALPVLRTSLRPPGAIGEKDFLETCFRCGNCVSVCPAEAILTVGPEEPDQAGTPKIDPDLAACVVCDELACMKSCPSGALRLVAEADINMGLARWHPRRCLRTAGDDCQICVEKCPLGERAIALDRNGNVQINPDGCVGCGSCQFFCPTIPKAVTVEPD